MRKERFQKLLFFLIFILFILLGIYGLNQFKVRKVYFVSPIRIDRGLEILNKKNLLFLNNERISHYLLQQNIEIKSATIDKVFPDTLIINLTLREPIAKIVNNFNQIYYLDNEGTLLLPMSGFSDSLPTVEVASIPLLLGIKSDWRIQKTVGYLNDLKRENLSVDKIAIDEKMLNFHIFLSDGAQVIVPETGDSSLIAASLQIITSRFRIEGKLINLIDFRFEKPIIIFSTGEKISSN